MIYRAIRTPLRDIMSFFHLFTHTSVCTGNLTCQRVTRLKKRNAVSPSHLRYNVSPFNGKRSSRHHTNIYTRVARKNAHCNDKKSQRYFTSHSIKNKPCE